jgi:hypothetical protein
MKELAMITWAAAFIMILIRVIQRYNDTRDS